MGKVTPWPWTSTLAMLESKAPARVYKILFGSVKRRMEKLGLEEGDVVRLRGREGGYVIIENGDGRELRIERPYAWFVRVMPSTN